MYGVEPLLPYVGRQYMSLESAQKDFDANKDFYTCFHAACSKQELKNKYPDLQEIDVRYGKNLEKKGVLKL